MKTNDYLDTANSYDYKLDTRKNKIDLPKTSEKNKFLRKRYICLDLEMTEFQAGQRSCVPGRTGEVIQFGAVMLDENFNMISKFSYWRGEGDIATFCWSKSDYDQLWCELEAKARHRYDLFACLKDFVDLQKIFEKLLSSKVSISLESAMKLLQMNYEGQVHNAYSDSFNTARILHKLICTESLELDFDYINPKKNNDKTEYKVPSTNYNCSFASFMSPELLAQFGLTAEDDSEDDSYEDYGVEEDTEFLEALPLAGLIDDEEISSLCEKYKITFNKWLKLATEVMNTEEMKVA